MTRRLAGGLSLQWKLPIAICALLLAVTAALSSIAYLQVERSSRDASSERLHALAGQLANILQGQSRQVTHRAHVMAADRSVAEFLRTGAAAARRQVTTSFAATLAADTTTLSLALRDSVGRIVLALGPGSARTGTVELPGRANAPATPDSAALGTLVAFGDTVAYPTVAMIADHGKRLGYLVHWRRTGGNSRAPARFSSLLGPGVMVLMGSFNGAWTDQVGPIPAPPRHLLEGNEVVRLAPPGAEPRLALASVVVGTPWIVLLEIPESAVLAPARRFREEMLIIGLALLGVGFAGASILSRRITGRLHQLTGTASSFSRGDFTQRSGIGGADELGRLALAFNVMAERVEDDLRSRARSEEQWRALFDSNPQPMWVYDVATLAFLAVNHAAVEKYGYSREEFLGMSILDIRPPEDVALLIKQLDEPMPELAATQSWRHRRKDGSDIDVEVSSHAIDFSGRQARLILAQDVSGRTTLERQLRQSQKMEAVGLLAGGVAHDFNNLLTVIMTYTDLVRSDLPEGDRKTEDLDVVIRAATQAHGLTRQLLAFSRQQVLRPVVLDPNQAIENLSTMLRRVIGEDIEFATEPGADVGRVRVDPGQLDQVLMNLVVNARDAMPGGGGLRIKTQRVEVEEEAARLNGIAQGGHFVVISVSDTGPGMSPEVRARIFEPFFTTKEPGKGTGLGLATVYGIVHQSGGYVTVYSELGMGTTFRIYLPAIQDDGTQATGPGGSPHQTRGTETVLLVEDDAAVRVGAAEVLTRHGYTVVAAHTPEEALARAAEPGQRLDLVITDVVMPGMDGPALVSRLREMRPAIKALFMSGYAGDAIVRRGLIESDVPFLEKPFSVKGLTRKVRETLDG